MTIIICICYAVAFIAGLACIIAPFLEQNEACKPEETHGTES